MYTSTQTNVTAKAKAALALLEEQFAYFTPEPPVSRTETTRSDDTPGTLPYHSAA
ncbi:hypothetical protein [Roseivivax halodurans]|nr:hypothetical protein [Roseivivax halodurans]